VIASRRCEAEATVRTAGSAAQPAMPWPGEAPPLAPLHPPQASIRPPTRRTAMP